MNAKDISCDQLVAAVIRVQQTAKNNRYTYGDSHAIPPTADHVISCDRLIAKALWDLGFQDQPVSVRTTSGMTIFNMTEYLTKHGWIQSKSKNDIRYGSIVLTKGGDGRPFHTFLSIDVFKNNTIRKYDMGSQTRIMSKQPFTEHWSGADFLSVFNLPSAPKPSTKQNVERGQRQLMNYTGIKLDIDGIVGPKTKAAYIKAVQKALNQDFNCGLVIDGIAGARTNAALSGHPIRYADYGYLVTALEIGLYLKNYNPNGVEKPGVFGTGCRTTLKQYQMNNGLDPDGIAGLMTFTSLMR